MCVQNTAPVLPVEKEGDCEMKKRILSLLLVLMMVMTLMPAAALADGVTADTTWYDAEKSEFVLMDAADLLGFAQLVNENNWFAGKTVKLGADIDLAGVEWTPIGEVDRAPSYVFKGIFDGQGYKIENLTYSDENTYDESGVSMHVSSSGLFGAVSGAVIKNVTLTNVTLSGTHYTGAIVAFCQDDTTPASIENCKVIGGTITVSAENGSGEWDNGDKVGGIVGYTSSSSAIKNCTVENVTIKGYRDIGGIAGYSSCPVTGCTVKDVKIIVDTEHNYKNYKTKADVKAYEIAAGAADDCAAVNVSLEYPSVVAKLGEKEYLDLNAALADAAKATTDQTVTLLRSVDLSGKAWTPVFLDGNAGAAAVTLEGCGFTVSGLDKPLFKGAWAGNTGITIKDLTISNANINYASTEDEMGVGAFINDFQAAVKVELINCHLKDSTVANTGDARVGGLIGWNAGWSSEADPVDTCVTIKDCTVENCKISGQNSVGGIIGHAGASSATHNTVVGCEVKNCVITAFDTSYRVGAVVGTANIGVMEIKDTVSSGNLIQQFNGVSLVARPENQSELYGRTVYGTAYGNTGKLIIDGVAVHDHDCAAVVTSATCTTEGYTTYTCTCEDCAYSYTDNRVAALGHDYKDGVCTVCGAIDPTANPFTDVDPVIHAPYYDAILWANYNGITKGTGVGIFEPQGDCTRAQIITFLWRINGSPAVEGVDNPFTDVDPKIHKDFYNAILWGYSKGIINGTSATTFGPDETCTRAQIVTMLYRQAGSPAASGDTGFTDTPQLWYKDAIAWAVAEGITNGTSATTFSPEAPCTRAETVTFLYRFYAD